MKNGAVAQRHTNRGPRRTPPCVSSMGLGRDNCVHIVKGVLMHPVDPHHGRTPWVYATKFFCLVVEELHVTLPCIPTCVKSKMQLPTWYWLLASQTPLRVSYPSQRTSVPSCKQARLIRDSPRSLIERREEPQEGSKIVPFAQRAAYPLMHACINKHKPMKLIGGIYKIEWGGGAMKLIGGSYEIDGGGV